MTKPAYRVLLVDDEPLLLEVITDLLYNINAQIDTATSGNQAWELCQKHSYDFVLTDVRMPDGNGIELTKKLKARNPVCPCVMIVTGYTDMLCQEVYNIGADSKFAKPFDNNDLRRAVNICLLGPNQKWQNYKPENQQFKYLEMAGQSISALEKENKVLFGRGGFFIACEAAPEVGDNIRFSINIDVPTKINFDGYGIVRWSKPRPGHLPNGVGIEIVGLCDSMSKKYQMLFGGLVPFIPWSSKI